MKKFQTKTTQNKVKKEEKKVYIFINQTSFFFSQFLVHNTLPYLSASVESAVNFYLFTSVSTTTTITPIVEASPSS